MSSITPKHKWQFAPRFKRGAFGWRSDLPTKRIKEALFEIKAVCKADAVLAAEGAVMLIEKLVPSIEHVDSSSGSLGTAISHALETLAKIIAKPTVDIAQRNAWLQRIWQAAQDDGYGYLSSIDEYWPMMCASPEVGAHWADEFGEMTRSIMSNPDFRNGYFPGESFWYASLFAAERYEYLLGLSHTYITPSWSLHRWRILSLAQLARIDEAIEYAETKVDGVAIEYLYAMCEDMLLKEDRHAEAYTRFAFIANRANSNLSTLRAIAKKYPEVPPEVILEDLISSNFWEKGKWFAAAKSLGLYERAIELVSDSPTDPNTLIRAARDFAVKQPKFAFQSALAAMRWLLLGYGYEMTKWDLMSALSLTRQIADTNGYGRALVHQFLFALETEPRLNHEWFDEVMKSNIPL